MFKQILFTSALLAGIPVLAMERVTEMQMEKEGHLSDDEKVTIQLSEETNADIMHEVEISARLAKYIGAIRTLVESPYKTGKPLPLFEVTRTTWRLIEPWIEKLSGMVHDDDATAHVRKEIVAAFGKFDSHGLIEIIRAIDYLEIPLLLELACEAVSSQDLIAHYTFEQISSLPGDLGNRFILKEFLKKIGPAHGRTLSQVSIEGPEALQASYVTEVGTAVSGFHDGSLSVHDRQGQMLAEWKGHEDIVCSLFVTQDGTIVSGSGDGTIGVWNMKGEKLAFWRGHEARVQAVCVTQDHKIVSGSHDATIRLWDMSGNPEVVFEGLGNTNALCMTNDGAIVAGSVDKTVRVMTMEGLTLAELDHESPILAVCVTHDNKIVSGSSDGIICLWDIWGNVQHVFRGHDRWVKSLSESKQGNIISGGKDRSVRVWDSSSGKELFVFKGHAGMIVSVTITSKGTIVSRSQDNIMRTLDVGLLQKIVRMDGLHAKVLWEFLRGIVSLNVFKSDDNAESWIRIEEILDEEDLEAKLHDWIGLLKLDPKCFEVSE